MSPRTSTRTAPCTPADGRARLRKAQSFVTGAELALGVGDDPVLDLPGVAAALAVLAGIAAALSVPRDQRQAAEAAPPHPR